MRALLAWEPSNSAHPVLSRRGQLAHGPPWQVAADAQGVRGVDVDLWPTGHRFDRGHRIVIEPIELLDVGGGTGAYAIGLCRYHPHLSVTVYELDFVAGWAKEEVREAGFGDRIEVVAGDFIGAAELPSGHDVIMLNSVLHDWDSDTAHDLLAKCYHALSPGGSIVVNELMLN